MNKEEFEAMEVKPEVEGWYWVTLFQSKKDEPKDPTYVKEWVEFIGDDWDYRELKDRFYVCFIHKREDAINLVNTK